jgi:hypothetical protein
VNVCVTAETEADWASTSSGWHHTMSATIAMWRVDEACGSHMARGCITTISLCLSPLLPLPLNSKGTGLGLGTVPSSYQGLIPSSTWDWFKPILISVMMFCTDTRG